MAELISTLLKTILLIKVKDMVMIMMGLTILAFTAASPIINAPMMEMADP